MEELISVIVPVYNAILYLNDCLNSLSNQTDDAYEVILVDDGSTDDSGVVCESYCKQYSNFRLIRKCNGGVSSARNEGIKRSKGKLICFVDSDDYVNSEYISDLRREMQSGVDFVLSKFYFIDGTKTITPSQPNRKHGKVDILFDKDTIIACQAPYGKLFKREILERKSISFDEKVRYGEDRLFVYSYLLNSNVVVISPCINYYYIRREGSLTSKIYSVEAEFYAYNECRRVICSLIKEMNLSDKRKVGCLYAEICDFGNRVLNAIYHSHGLSRSERLSLMYSIDMDFHSKFLRADSLKEWFIRLLLRLRLYNLYDIIRYLKNS